MHFFTKHLLLLTHAGVVPCVKTNDISRILSENWNLENFIEKMKDERQGEEEWSVVVEGVLD